MARAVDGRPAAAALRAFRRACASDGAPASGDTIVVALSGGLDSTALLHLARFAWPRSAEAPRIVAAHFDHGMRPGSAADARWVRGLCRAWRIELVEGAADRPLRSEAEARSARYAFLRRAAAGHGATAIVTAHHADDQAETVLFRVLRGTGAAGLRGIPRARAGLWRPLLGVWREELLDYADAVRLGWRDDATNVDLGYARNALRHRIIPEAERLVAPGARRALVRLAERSARDEEAWESLLPSLVASLAPERDADGVRVDRAPLAALHPAVRARVLRALALELGLRPDARRTRLAVDFAASAASGRRIDLGDGVVLRRDLERIALTRPAPEGRREPDRPLVIPGPASGAGEAVLAGRIVWVGWGEEARTRTASVELFRAEALRFPLSLRAWEAGDRMRTRHGTRKLKRVFLEARVPSPERRRAPVLADAEGEVLWIPGVARSPVAPAPPDDGGGASLPIGVA